MDRITGLRAREYPETTEGPFFNSASWGLVPASAATEVADLVSRRNRTHGFQERELGAIQARCRSAVARLLDASEDEVALVPNTSFGVSLAAALVRTGPPGIVLVSAGEFPANVLPWCALEDAGFAVEVVPNDDAGLPDEEALLARLASGSVRACAVSAVQFASGHRADLARIGEACRTAGAVFCVDAIQALGVDRFTPSEVGADIVACGGQKWLCGPWGSGFVWVRRELHDRFDSPIVSWLAVEGAMKLEGAPEYRLDWRGNARKFEPATLGVQDYLGLARSVEVLLEAGIQAIREHVFEVQQPVLEWADRRGDVSVWTPRERERRAGIVAFRPPRFGEVVAALDHARVVYSVREGAIRFAPHFYSTVDEMEQVVAVMDEAATA